GVAHDDQIFSADIATAVQLVDERRRKAREIDLVVAEHILEHRTRGQHPRWNHPGALLHPCPVALYDIESLFRDRYAEHDGEALERVRGTGQDPIAGFEALDLVEQDRRLGAGMADRDQLAECTELEMGVRILDTLDLSHRLEALDEITQVLVRGTG